MDYVSLKITHVSCVVISYALFVLRGVWMIRDSAQLQRRWVKIVPHVNDTLLLASAIALVVMSRQYPLAHGWLTVKIVGLIFYIGLGMVALRHGKTRHTRIAAWIAAQVVFFYMVAVALARSAAPILG
ncbi:MAG: regulator SirB [Betaproteobacteria bacterium RIFCSPLOWO2_12_FULL_62_13]|nr:MAG: regulator SirB [Betaproteobacteria bacterium RIFCSPLOWO2_12_FULL_62_13]